MVLLYKNHNMYYTVAKERIHNKTMEHNNTVAAVTIQQRKNSSRLAINLGDEKLVDLIENLLTWTTTMTTTTKGQGLKEVPYVSPVHQSRVRSPRIWSYTGLDA